MATQKKLNGILISNFNINNLERYLQNDFDLPKVDIEVAPFDQIFATLTEQNSVLNKKNYDFALVWSLPEKISKHFNNALSYEIPSIDEIFKEIDQYTSLLLTLQSAVKAVFIPTWVIPSYNRGLGMLNMKKGIGISNTLMRMNIRLCENLEKATTFYIFDTSKWLQIAGEHAFSPKMWYMGKIPFGNAVFKEAVKDIKASLNGISGQSVKIVILDLDDTLWGGIVGDQGWENIRIGGHDCLGEAFADFQRALKSLKNRGILLGIVSKNEEATALEAINKHPEMILKEEDFAGWRINWQDKAQNVADLISELNLGLQSALFIDDNPVERARVNEALPEVIVPDWPIDKTLYTSTLLSLRCFDSPVVSHEDIQRTKMYQSEKKRRKLKKQITSLDDWLKTLEITVRIEEANPKNLPRITQLLNKTNQMNLTTRRANEKEIQKWLEQDSHKMWAFRVSDKFGDSGLTGIMSLATEKNIGVIEDFILSCRVMGRKIEEVMLYKATDYARSIGLKRIEVEYIQTAKNKPCQDFFKQSKFNAQNGYKLFSWSLKSTYLAPDFIKIIDQSPICNNEQEI